MNNSKYYLAFIFGILSICSLQLTAQQQNKKVNFPDTKEQITFQKSKIHNTSLSNNIDHSKPASNWKTSLINYSISHKKTIIFDKDKAQKLKDKQDNTSSKKSDKFNKSSEMAPNVTGGFGTMDIQNATPPDNTMAISKAGLIVTAVNESVEYYDSLGNRLYKATFNDFLNDTSIISFLYDPMIEYDRDNDRFVMVILDSFTDSTSKVIISFSKTNNPLDGWWTYYLTGNPLNDSSWFDFPKIGISESEIFVTGNLFSNNGELHTSIIYQINKSKGYNGDTLQWIHWSNLSGNPSILVPVNSGIEENYGPGLYFISTFSFDDTVAMIPYLRIYNISDSINSNPTISYSSQILPFGIAVNGAQKGVPILMNIIDPRGADAFYLNGIIHFVYTSEYNNGYAGINYNRLDVATMNNWHSVYGEPNMDCTYASMVSFGPSTEKSAIFAYLRTGVSIHPEVRTICCDNNGAWTVSSIIKEGTSYVSFLSSDGFVRWGDYTDICRRYVGSQTQYWANGCYGEKYISGTGSRHYLDSWIGKIEGLSISSIDNNIIDSKINIYPNPSVDMFNIDFELKNKEYITISIYDINGKKIKTFYRDIAKKGKNTFSFNKGALSSGMYILTIEFSTDTPLSKKIIIQ